jgi:hypothetical protein
MLRLFVTRQASERTLEAKTGKNTLRYHRKAPNFSFGAFVLFEH